MSPAQAERQVVVFCVLGERFALPSGLLSPWALLRQRAELDGGQRRSSRHWAYDAS